MTVAVMKIDLKSFIPVLLYLLLMCNLVIFDHLHIHILQQIITNLGIFSKNQKKKLL